MMTWRYHDTRYPSPGPENPRFMNPRAAAAPIGDGDVVAVSGLGGNQRASIVFWAVREAFEETGHPARLTLVNLGGHGGRGLAPGTLEEIGQRGLCRRLISGHFETLADGKRVFYATPVGLFQLTGRGMTLVRVMPGLDVQRDVVEVAAMRVVLPESGTVRLVPPAIVTGKGFAPRLGALERDDDLDRRDGPLPRGVRGEASRSPRVEAAR